MNSSACEGNSSGISRCKCFFLFRGSASQSPFQSRIASDCIIRARLEPVLVAGAAATRSTGARRLVRNHQCWSSAHAPEVLSILLTATYSLLSSIPPPMLRISCLVRNLNQYLNVICSQHSVLKSAQMSNIEQHWLALSSNEQHVKLIFVKLWFHQPISLLSFQL